MTSITPHFRRRNTCLPQLRVLAGSARAPHGLRGGAACSRPLPNRVVTTGLVVATLLVAAAVAFDFLAPLILT